MGASGVQFCDVWGLDPALLQMVFSTLLGIMSSILAQRWTKPEGKFFQTIHGIYFILVIFSMALHTDLETHAVQLRLFTALLMHHLQLLFLMIACSVVLSEKIEAPDAVGDALCNAQNIQEASDTEAQGATTTPARGKGDITLFACLAASGVTNGTCASWWTIKRYRWPRRCDRDCSGSSRSCRSWRIHGNGYWWQQLQRSRIVWCAFVVIHRVDKQVWE